MWEETKAMLSGSLVPCYTWVSCWGAFWKCGSEDYSEMLGLITLTKLGNEYLRYLWDPDTATQ